MSIVIEKPNRTFGKDTRYYVGRQRQPQLPGHSNLARSNEADPLKDHQQLHWFESWRAAEEKLAGAAQKLLTKKKRRVVPSAGSSLVEMIRSKRQANTEGAFGFGFIPAVDSTKNYKEDSAKVKVTPQELMESCAGEEYMERYDIVDQGCNESQPIEVACPMMDGFEGEGANRLQNGLLSSCYCHWEQLSEAILCDIFRKEVTTKHVVPDYRVVTEVSASELEEALEKIRNYEQYGPCDATAATTSVAPGSYDDHWNHRDGSVDVNGKTIYWRLYNTKSCDSRHGTPDSLCGYGPFRNIQ